MYRSGHDVWAPEFCARRPDVTRATVDAYLQHLYRVQLVGFASAKMSHRLWKRGTESISTDSDRERS